MRSSLLAFAAIGFIVALVSCEAIGRTWKTKSGKFSIEAELVEVKEGKVVLKKPNGEVLEVPLEILSQADQNYIQSLSKKKVAKAATGRNKIVGMWVEAKFEVDEAKLKKILEMNEVPADRIEQNIKEAKSYYGKLKITVVFGADGTSLKIVEEPGQPANEVHGKWKIIEEAGKTVKIMWTDKREEGDVLTLIFKDHDKFDLKSKDLDQAPVKRTSFLRTNLKMSLRASAQIGISKTLAKWIELLEAKKYTEFMQSFHQPTEVAFSKENGGWEKFVKSAGQSVGKMLKLLKAVQYTIPRISPGGTLVTYKAQGKGEIAFVRIDSTWHAQMSILQEKEKVKEKKTKENTKEK